MRFFLLILQFFLRFTCLITFHMSRIQEGRQREHSVKVKILNLPLFALNFLTSVECKNVTLQVSSCQNDRMEAINFPKLERNQQRILKNIYIYEAILRQQNVRQPNIFTFICNTRKVGSTVSIYSTITFIITINNILVI